MQMKQFFLKSKCSVFLCKYSIFLILEQDRILGHLCGILDIRFVV